MDCKFKVGDKVTWIGRDEIGTVAEVLQARPDAQPLYSIKVGNELTSAGDNELQLFLPRQWKVEATKKRTLLASSVTEV
jgi:hypothetical protein